MIGCFWLNTKGEIGYSTKEEIDEIKPSTFYSNPKILKFQQIPEYSPTGNPGKDKQWVINFLTMFYIESPNKEITKGDILLITEQQGITHMTAGLFELDGN